MEKIFENIFWVVGSLAIMVAFIVLTNTIDRDLDAGLIISCVFIALFCFAAATIISLLIKIERNTNKEDNS